VIGRPLIQEGPDMLIEKSCNIRQVTATIYHYRNQRQCKNQIQQSVSDRDLCPSNAKGKIWTNQIQEIYCK